MRVLVLWAVLFAVYAATLGVDAVGRSDYAVAEAHHLLAAESIVSDRDLDLADQYAARAFADFYPYRLVPEGKILLGRRLEPYGFGFAGLIAPAYALGGAKAVELFLAAIAALAFALAAALARRIVPEPWASGGVLLAGLSPPALAYATAVTPDLAAGAMLAGAALAALRVREASRLGSALVGAALLAVLPWLGAKYLVAAAPVAFVLVRWTARRGRRLAALAAGEVMVASLVMYVTLNDRLYGGPTPYSVADSATGASSALDYLERAPLLAGLWVDRDVGLLRWAPVLALAGFAAWLLWRSRRGHVARLVPERGDAEAAAGLALAVCAGQLIVAAFAAPAIAGAWFPGRQLVAALPAAAALVAWGLRHAPRAGAALGALTLLASGWLAVELAFGGLDGWAAPDTDAPLGPAVRALPRYGSDAPWADVASIALAAALAVLVAREWRATRAERAGGAGPSGAPARP